MGHFGQKIIAILVAARMVIQVKFVTGGEGAAVARAGDQVVRGLLFFHADLGERIAFGFFCMDPGIIINFVFSVSTDFGNGLHIGHQGSVRRLKIIVRESVLAGPQLLFSAPAFHDVFLLKSAARSVVEAHFMLDGTVFVDLGLVGEYQLVGVLVVLKEIEDAVLFHQARDKVEGSLAILDDVFALGVGALGTVLEVLEAVVLKNLLDDLGDSFLLENLAIGGAREEPEPRNNFCLIVAKAVIPTGATKTAYEAIPMTLIIAGMLDLEGYLLADDIFEGNRVVFGEQLRCHVKEFGNTLSGDKIVK